MKEKIQHVTRFLCGNEAFGCGQGIEWTAYNNRANACHSCCNRAARNWSVDITDLPMLTVAIINARAGKMGCDATYEEVWSILEILKVPRKFHVPVPGTVSVSDSQLPKNDREGN